LKDFTKGYFGYSITPEYVIIYYNALASIELWEPYLVRLVPNRS